MGDDICAGSGQGRVRGTGGSLRWEHSGAEGLSLGSLQEGGQLEEFFSAKMNIK